MPADAVRRLARRLDAGYTEELVRRHRAAGGVRPATPVVRVPPVATAPLGRIAVVAHAFYPELLEQLRRSIANLPPRPDVFVSVPTEEVRERTLTVLGRLDLGRLDVRVVANRGRDIAPKYVAFADVYEQGHDLVLFLHTKKSLTADFGDDWRDQLFRSLVGSPQIVNGIVGLFAADSRLGVVAPGHHGSIGSTTGWDGNYPEARRLARRAGLEVHRWSAPDFPSGSMFWARPQALAALTRLGLRLDEFPDETGQVGFTVMHALERMVFVAAAHEGFHSVMVTDPNAVVDDADAAPRSQAASSPGRGPTALVRSAAAAALTAKVARTVLRRVRARAVSSVTRIVRGDAGRAARNSPQGL